MGGWSVAHWTIRAAAVLGALCLCASHAAAQTPDQASDPNTPTALRAEAWEAAQWAIASEAADALAKVSARFAQGDDALGRLAESRETLIQQRDAQERRLERLYASDDAADLAERSRTRTAYEATLEQLRQVDADIEARFPAYSELTSPQALSIAETQALLGPDEAVLLILVNPEAA